MEDKVLVAIVVFVAVILVPTIAYFAEKHFTSMRRKVEEKNKGFEVIPPDLLESVRKSRPVDYPIRSQHSRQGNDPAPD